MAEVEHRRHEHDAATAARHVSRLAPPSRARPIPIAPATTPAEKSPWAVCIRRVLRRASSSATAPFIATSTAPVATPSTRSAAASAATELGERGQHRRHREPRQHRRQDAWAAAVEQAAGGEHRRQRTDGHEEQRETELTLRRADRVLDRRHERRPAAPDGAEREERGQRPAPPHTRSQPSGSCGIGHEGSGRQSSQPVGNGHSSRTRAASARTAPASTRPSAAACSSSSSSFQR